MDDRLPPLTLYIHLPWCVRKCPYCDFNSHPLRGPLDETGYVSALLTDLSGDLQGIAERPLQSIFIGGGTPSLFSPSAIGRLLAGVRQLMDCAAEAEITLEANPGSLEAVHFPAYREAGVNRLSIGVQSFDAGCLQALGRIHNPDQAIQAAQLAKQAGFERLNLDLMFGLPGQTEEGARDDLRIALELDPGHLSYYQLTLEPNTPFYQSPPQLPTEEHVWLIQQQALQLLKSRDYEQYEISAYARDGQRCRHNLNYWTFGDYLGIGAGAHGKLTRSPGDVLRTSKWRLPREYLRKLVAGDAIQGQRTLAADDLLLESMMNLLRLREGFALGLFEARTGLPRSFLEAGLARALSRGLVRCNADHVEATALGRRFLNELLAIFVPG